jgi:hypothetical protein
VQSGNKLAAETGATISDFVDGWTVKGKTSVINRLRLCRSNSAASAVSARRGFRFETHHDALNAEWFTVWRKKMAKGRSEPVHLEVDGLPPHSQGVWAHPVYQGQIDPAHRAGLCARPLPGTTTSVVRHK